MSLFRVTFCTTPDGKPVSCLEGIPVTFSAGLMGSAQVKVTVPVHANLAPEFKPREHTRPLYYSVAVERQSREDPGTWILVEAGIIVNTDMNWRSGEMTLICVGMVDLLKKRVLTDEFANPDWPKNRKPNLFKYPETRSLELLLYPLRKEGHGWPKLTINYRGDDATYGHTYPLNEFYNTHTEALKALDGGVWAFEYESYTPDFVIDGRWWEDNTGTDESYRRNRTRTLWNEGRLQYQGIVGNDKAPHVARNPKTRPHTALVSQRRSEAIDCRLEVNTSKLFDGVAYGGPIREIKDSIPKGKTRSVGIAVASTWNTLERPMFTAAYTDEMDGTEFLREIAVSHLEGSRYPQLTFSIEMRPGLEKTLYWKSGDWIQILLEDETILPNAKQLAYTSRIMTFSGDGEGKLSLQIDPIPEERGL